MPEISFSRTVPEIKPRTKVSIPMALIFLTTLICAFWVQQATAVGELPPQPKVQTTINWEPIKFPELPPVLMKKNVAPKPVPNPGIPPTEAQNGFKPEAPPPEIDRIFDNPGPGFVPGDDSFRPADVPPPPPPPPAPKVQEPLHVGGVIQQPIKTHDVKPIYPAIAQSARVQGVVIIEAMIGTDGRVKDARVLRSIPLLDDAALVAVRQWEFTPTLLNGKVVEVIMTVTVQFNLN